MFSDTSERLDLLALDEAGRVIVIENKLDDSGKDVVWQALKYVSYCASLSKSEIRDIFQKYLDQKQKDSDAETLLTEFFECSDYSEVKINSGDSDQRIILVAANFRKEVTSTVLWLQNHNVDIKCIRVTPFQLDDKIFLDTEQILPPPNTEEYQIRLGIKKQEENIARKESCGNDLLRRSFWTKAIPKLITETEIYQNVSPTKDNWITGASGHTGIGFNSVALLNCARAEIYIGRSSADENKKIYDYLFKQKDDLESKFGEELKWERLDSKIGSRVSISKRKVRLDDQGDWDEIIRFLAKNIQTFRKVFTDPLNEAIKEIKKSSELI